MSLCVEIAVHGRSNVVPFDSYLEVACLCQLLNKQPFPIPTQLRQECGLWWRRVARARGMQAPEDRCGKTQARVLTARSLTVAVGGVRVHGGLESCDDRASRPEADLLAFALDQNWQLLEVQRERANGAFRQHLGRVDAQASRRGRLFPEHEVEAAETILAVGRVQCHGGAEASLVEQPDQPTGLRQAPGGGRRRKPYEHLHAGISGVDLTGRSKCRQRSPTACGTGSKTLYRSFRCATTPWVAR